MYKYIFGPVLSRRFGLSLGIDLIPYKTCSLDCVYCECGRTTNLTVERKSYIKLDVLYKELEDILKKDKKIDHITFSGAGEPTLNSDIGKIIDKIKELTQVPVVVLTNGTLFYLQEVRNDILKADIVAPSINAVTEKILKKINRYHPGLEVSKIIEGLIQFRKEYKGKIWLEILFVKGYNDDPEEVKKISGLISQIKPDKVQLNTCIRPGTEKEILPLSFEELEKISEYFDLPVEIITLSNFNKNTDIKNLAKGLTIDEIVEMLKRRPCTIQDLSSLNNSSALIIKDIFKYLEGQGIKIKSRTIKDEEYFYIENK